MKFKIKILRSTAQKELNGQIWLVRDDSELNIQQSEVVAKLPLTITKRFYFGTDTGDPCSNHIANGFATILKSDPNYVGQIVDFNVSRNKRTAAAAEWIKWFREEYGISRERLRIYFKNEKSDRFVLGKAELWITPSKKNK
jgi:hypothetical protein